MRKRFKSPREALQKLGIDESLLDVRRLALDGARKMPKPTRLEYLAVTRTAAALNPLLALDKKVEYGPIFAGLTLANLKGRKPTIMSDLKKALKGNTIAADASVEHLAHMLDQFEHVNEPKSLDESVSGEQHRAMEAAAHGHSNLGIPAEVGKEFEKADKGHAFRDALPAFLKEHGMDDASIEEAMDMIPDEMPENTLDEHEEDDEDEKDRAEDEREDEAEDEDEGEEGKKGAKDRHARDRKGARDTRHAKDRKGAMDTKSKKLVTVDEMNTAIEATAARIQKSANETAEARAFVEPFVGKLPLALDSAEKVLRAAARALEIEEADTIHPSALRTIIKITGGARTSDEPAFNSAMALDAAAEGAASAEKIFGLNRIKAVS